MTILPETRPVTKASLSQPGSQELAILLADRVLAGVPTLASKVSRDDLAGIMAAALDGASSKERTLEDRIAQQRRISDLFGSPGQRITEEDQDTWFRLLHNSEVLGATKASQAAGCDSDVAAEAGERLHARRLLALVQAQAEYWGSGHGRQLKDEYADQLTIAIGVLADERTSVAPGRVTGPSVRTEVAEFVASRAHTYAHQGDDRRSPRVRALDIERAAVQGVEDAAVAGCMQAHADDGVRRSEASTRYGIRLGRLIGDDLDAVFKGCAAEATERGENPAYAVAQLAEMLTGYVTAAAEHAGGIA